MHTFHVVPSEFAAVIEWMMAVDLDYQYWPNLNEIRWPGDPFAVIIPNDNMAVEFKLRFQDVLAK